MSISFCSELRAWSPECPEFSMGWACFPHAPWAVSCSPAAAEHSEHVEFRSGTIYLEMASLWPGSESQRKNLPLSAGLLSALLDHALEVCVPLVGCPARPGAVHCLCNEVFKHCTTAPAPWAQQPWPLLKLLYGSWSLLNGKQWLHFKCRCQQQNSFPCS